MNYDISENKSDLHLLDNVEPNIKIDNADLFMELSYAMMDCYGAKTISEDDFEYEILELHKGDIFINVSKYDVEAIAKHFGLI